MNHSNGTGDGWEIDLIHPATSSLFTTLAIIYALLGIENAITSNFRAMIRISGFQGVTKNFTNPRFTWNRGQPTNLRRTSRRNLRQSNPRIVTNSRLPERFLYTRRLITPPISTMEYITMVSALGPLSLQTFGSYLRTMERGDITYFPYTELLVIVSYVTIMRMYFTCRRRWKTIRIPIQGQNEQAVDIRHESTLMIQWFRMAIRALIDAEERNFENKLD